MTELSLTKLTEIWPLCGEASQAIFTATRSSVNPIVDETGLTQPRALHTLLLALALDPESISPERICGRYPYATRDSWDQPMQALAERQLLTKHDNGSYQLTPGGRAIVTRVLKEFYGGLAGLEKSIEMEYPAADRDRLAALLDKLITACFAAPIVTTNLKDSHGLVPAGSTLARIDQALDDLNAFRDDAHLAAWQPLGVAGYTWETFTFLWRGEVKNADEMAEKAKFRGHSREAYQSALGDLIGRGWVRAAGENTFEVTDAGRQVREEAEAATDRNFYTPWKTLNETETGNVRDLLARLKIVVTHTVEAVPA